MRKYELNSCKEWRHLSSTIAPKITNQPIQTIGMKIRRRIRMTMRWSVLKSKLLKTCKCQWGHTGPITLCDPSSCSALWQHVSNYLKLMGLVGVIGNELIKFPAFWDMNPCRLVTYTDTNTPEESKRSCRSVQQAPMKWWNLYTNINGVMSQKNGILINWAFRTSNLTRKWQLLSRVWRTAGKHISITEESRRSRSFSGEHKVLLS
jgi:hypothetical protein